MFGSPARYRGLQARNTRVGRQRSVLLTIADTTVNLLSGWGRRGDTLASAEYHGVAGAVACWSGTASFAS